MRVSHGLYVIVRQAEVIRGRLVAHLQPQRAGIGGLPHVPGHGGPGHPKTLSYLVVGDPGMAVEVPFNLRGQRGAPASCAAPSGSDPAMVIQVRPLHFRTGLLCLYITNVKSRYSVIPRNGAGPGKRWASRSLIAPDGAAGGPLLPAPSFSLVPHAHQQQNEPAAQSLPSSSNADTPTLECSRFFGYQIQAAN
jgi:hypothetical protein